MQVALQRRTSELTLNSVPSVEVMTQLEISAAKSEKRVAEDKKRDKEHSNILAFTEDILKAHLFEGKFQRLKNKKLTYKFRKNICQFY